MDFFSHQEKARKKTFRLILYLILATLGIGLTVYAVLFFVLSGDSGGLLRWDLLLSSVGGTTGVVALGSASKMAALSGGGKVVAESLGGRLVQPTTRDPKERQLLNVVEEMSIASGVPVPDVYLLEHELGINAFAAGLETDNAVIGVTRGCLDQLNRDELQGVMAHEFSHILNGDMRLNVRLIGLIAGILLISTIGAVILRSFRYVRVSSGDSKDGGAAIIVIILLSGLALYLIGSLGVFFGNLIKSAISRQREFLADASAVQFTRNPEGIGGALLKIGGYTAGSELKAPNAAQASHMYFAKGISGFFSDMFATHPPVLVRVERISPELLARAEEFEATAPGPRHSEPQASAGPVSGVTPLHGTREKSTIRATTASQLAERAGTLEKEDIETAQALYKVLPKELLEAAQEISGAYATLLGLLLSRDPQARREQLQFMDVGEPPRGVLVELKRLLPVIDNLPRRHRLPMVDLCFSGLRRLSLPQFKELRRQLQALAEHDRRIDLFEYVLLKLASRQLDHHYGAAAPTQARIPDGARIRSLDPVRKEISLLLSSLAHIGLPEPGSDENRAKSSIRQGNEFLPDFVAELVRWEQCSLKTIDAAIQRLDRLQPKLKRGIIAACAAIVTHDRKVTVDEIELLRAISESLGVPMPVSVGRLANAI